MNLSTKTKPVHPTPRQEVAVLTAQAIADADL